MIIIFSLSLETTLELPLPPTPSPFATFALPTFFEIGGNRLARQPPEVVTMEKRHQRE